MYNSISRNFFFANGVVAMPSKESVKSLTVKVADWQLKTFNEQIKYRALSTRIQAGMSRFDQIVKENPESRTVQFLIRNAKNWHDLEWHNVPFYLGLNKLHSVTKDAIYEQWLNRLGEKNSWALYERPYPADDHAVGQLYLSRLKKKQ